jgi:isopenicillin N synthase-like dioxygenase
MASTQIHIGGIMEARKVREPDKTTAFKELPIIDLADIDSPDQTKREAVAEKIYDACTQVGFFYVKNHGISRESLQNITGEAGRLFKDLPLEQKMKLARAHNEYHLGYSPFEKEKNEGASRIHRLESFLIGREAVFDAECGEKVGSKYDADNQWPEENELPGFKDAVGSYFRELLTFSRKLTNIFALSLKLDDSFFEHMIDRPGCLLSLNYYADKVEEQPDVHSGIAAHTDHELFTILYQTPGANALEVVNGDGVWVPAPPIEDTFVVNIGDALSIWTNNVFLSTLHRAVNTSGNERFSIPFFFGANYDAVMETLPSCVTETRPMKYKSVTAGEHYLSKMNDSYGYGRVAA